MAKSNSMPNGLGMINLFKGSPRTSHNGRTILKRMEKERLKHGNDYAITQGFPSDPKDYFTVRKGVSINKVRKLTS